MNYQFFGTAGILSGVLWIAALVFSILYCVGCCCWWYYKRTNLMAILGWICFLLPIAFWLVIGIICGLSELWNWGLVQCLKV